MALAASTATILACAQPAGSAAALAPFSAATPGAGLPAGWRIATLPRVARSEVTLDTLEDATVLRVRSHASAGGAAFAFVPPLAPRARLSWRWKVDRVVANADLATKAGDDFAARVYVFFDIPLTELPWPDRVKLRLARLLRGRDVPSAGICYVWDNRHAKGAISPNPYVPQVRTFVLESGRESAGAWREERRDLEADFRAAFPERTAPVPAVTGIAAGNDTDQTGERATAWFGDFRWEPAS
jgi:hypothetical protein